MYGSNAERTRMRSKALQLRSMQNILCTDVVHTYIVNAYSERNQRHLYLDLNPAVDTSLATQLSVLIS